MPAKAFALDLLPDTGLRFSIERKIPHQKGGEDLKRYRDRAIEQGKAKQSVLAIGCGLRVKTDFVQ